MLVVHFESSAAVHKDRMGGKMQCTGQRGACSHHVYRKPPYKISQNKLHSLKTWENNFLEMHSFYNLSTRRM
jgi:hypothetical protein